LIHAVSSSLIFLLLFGLAEIGLPQSIRLVAGPLFGPTNAIQRKKFYDEYRRGRSVRFGIALASSFLAGLALGFFDGEEVQVALLIAVVALFSLIVGLSVWLAARRTRPIGDPEKAR
jgi:hypothetical protein